MLHFFWDTLYIVNICMPYKVKTYDHISRRQNKIFKTPRSLQSTVCFKNSMIWLQMNNYIDKPENMLVLVSIIVVVSIIFFQTLRLKGGMTTPSVKTFLTLSKLFMFDSWKIFKSWINFSALHKWLNLNSFWQKRILLFELYLHAYTSVNVLVCSMLTHLKVL